MTIYTIFSESMTKYFFDPFDPLFIKNHYLPIEGFQ